MTKLWEREYYWLEYCPSCKRKHCMKAGDCMDCGGRSGEKVGIPASESVANKCSFVNRCSGCEAYKDHLR